MLHLPRRFLRLLRYWLLNQPLTTKRRLQLEIGVGISLYRLRVLREKERDKQGSAADHRHETSPCNAIKK